MWGWVRVREEMSPRLGVEVFEALPDAELLMRYRHGLELMDQRIFELSDEQVSREFSPEAGAGLWPVRVLLGHLADADVAFTQWMRRAVAEDEPVVDSWNELAFIDSGMYSKGTVAEFVAVIRSMRRWTGDWLATLSPEPMARQIVHKDAGAMSVRRLMVCAAWHLEHHGWYLNAKMARILGPRPERGSCGAGCGCGKYK